MIHNSVAKMLLVLLQYLGKKDGNILIDIVMVIIPAEFISELLGKADGWQIFRLHLQN